MVIVVIKTASDNICYTQKFKWATNGFALTGPIVVIAKYLYGEIEKKISLKLIYRQPIFNITFTDNPNSKNTKR